MKIFILLLILKLSFLLAGELNYLLQKEKDNLTDLNNLVIKNIQVIRKIQTKINSKAVFDTAINKNKMCISDSSNSESNQFNQNCISALDLKSFDKKSKIYNFFNIPLIEDENILSFSFINVNKIGSVQEKKNTNSSFRPSFDSFVIVIFTNRSVILANRKGEVLTKHSLSFKENIIKADMTYFDEDGSITIISDKSDLIYFNIDIKVTGQSYDEIEAEVFIPLRKSITVNNNDKVVFLKQHKLHGHKYIVLAFENGNVLVISKDLEMKSSIILHRHIDNVFLNNGILSVISGSDMIFLNVLGGNSVLLKCNNYYNVLQMEYDTANNFLFVIDEELNFIIYNIKLSISKQNSNECNPVFHLKLPKIFKKFSDSGSQNKVHMEISRNVLYIIIDDEYIAIIDINLLNENGLQLNEFLLFRSGAGNRNSSHKNQNYDQIVSFFTFGGHATSNYILLNNNSETQELVLVEINNFKPPKQSNQIESNYSDQRKGMSNTQSSQNIFKNLFNFFFYSSNDTAPSFNNYFYIYLCLIIVLSIIVFFYKQKKFKDDKSKLSPKKFSEDDQKMLEDMMSSMENLKNRTGRVNTNKSKFSQEDYDENDAEAEDFDHENEEMEEFEEGEENEINEIPNN